MGSHGGVVWGGEDWVQEAKLTGVCHSPAGHSQQEKEWRTGSPGGNVSDGEQPDLSNQMGIWRAEGDKLDPCRCGP